MINKNILLYVYSNKPKLSAKIFGGDKYPKIFGLAEFYNVPSGVLLLYELENLPTTKTNIFAFHIHEGNLCENDFKDTLSHYNPKNQEHPNHTGDLPPIFSNNGAAFGVVFLDRFTLEEIENRTIVIHEDPDDFTSQPSGNSGEKIACGKILKI